jgi:hypothetical protein
MFRAEFCLLLYRVLRWCRLSNPRTIAPNMNPRMMASTGNPGIPPPPYPLEYVNTVEPIVVTDVNVVNMVELVVDEMTALDVEVNVELTVLISVAVWAGEIRRLGFASDGEIMKRATTKSRITPNVNP